MGQLLKRQILDNLPSISKTEDDYIVTSRFWGGFPVGFIDAKSSKAYIHNHVNIEVMYHAVEGEDIYQVVRFTVEPFSICRDNLIDEPPANITSPIPSCNKKTAKRYHTDYDMITAIGREPQLAMGKVLFTYDVLWYENMELEWSDRWYIYLSMDDSIPSRARWTVSVYSVVVAVVLGSLFLNLLIRDLRYRAEHLRQETNHEEPRWWSSCSCDRIVQAIMVLLVSCGLLVMILACGVVILSWRSDLFSIFTIMANAVLCGAFAICIERDLRYSPLLIHDSGDEEDNEGDSCEQDLRLWPLTEQAFDAPKRAPLLLSVLCGTGAQILATTVLSAIVFAFGLVPSSTRGAKLLFVLLVFTFMGAVGGHVTARLYKSFGGYLKGTIFAASLTALGFPGVAFLTWLAIDMYFQQQEGTTYSLLPRSTSLIMLGLWLCVMTPITMLSAFDGFRRGINRKVPIQPRGDESSEHPATTAHKNCEDTFLVRLLISGLLPVSAFFP